MMNIRPYYEEVKPRVAVKTVTLPLLTSIAPNHNQIEIINKNITRLKAILHDQGCKVGRDCSIHIIGDNFRSHNSKMEVKFYVEETQISEYLILSWSD